MSFARAAQRIARPEHSLSSLVFSEGLGDGALDGPSCFQPPLNGRMATAEAHSPLFKGKGEPEGFRGQKAVVPLVIALLASGGPADITGLIVPVLVGVTINRMVGRWSRADMLEEQVEAMKPAFPDGNTAPSVVLKAGEIGRVAAGLHGFPGIVFFGVLAVTAQTMAKLRIDSLAAAGFTIAPRRAGAIPGGQFAAGGEVFLTAVAETTPDYVVTGALLGGFDHDECAEALAGEVPDDARHLLAAAGVGFAAGQAVGAVEALGAADAADVPENGSGTGSLIRGTENRPAAEFPAGEVAMQGRGDNLLLHRSPFPVPSPGR